MTYFKVNLTLANIFDNNQTRAPRILSAALTETTMSDSSDAFVFLKLLVYPNVLETSTSHMCKCMCKFVAKSKIAHL
jgi:hypothetical protein